MNALPISTTSQVLVQPAPNEHRNGRINRIALVALAVLTVITIIGLAAMMGAPKLVIGAIVGIAAAKLIDLFLSAVNGKVRKPTPPAPQAAVATPAPQKANQSLYTELTKLIDRACAAQQKSEVDKSNELKKIRITYESLLRTAHRKSIISIESNLKIFEVMEKVSDDITDEGASLKAEIATILDITQQ